MCRILMVLTAMSFLLLTVCASRPEEEEASRPHISASNNRFALDLYGQLRGREGNLCFAPSGIHTVLTMTYAGARGETAEQMAGVLHLPRRGAQIHRALGGLVSRVQQGGPQEGSRIDVATALWGQKGYSFLEEFLSLLRENYGTGFEEVDFAADPEAARRVINAWAEEQTGGQIQNFVPRGVIRQVTRLVLANAMYFKGLWVSAFEEKRTRREFFWPAPDKHVEAAMMRQTGRFAHADLGTCQMLELPYKGEAFSMVILLPAQKGGLPKLEEQLDWEKLSGWLGQLRQERIVVQIPRFTVTNPLRLKEPLQSLGLREPFLPGADFSGMTGTRELFISAVIHKCFVEVDEEGTEAAAASGVVMGKGPGPRLPMFRADHPFLFFILHKQTGTILFAGRVVRPEEGEDQEPVE